MLDFLKRKRSVEVAPTEPPSTSGPSVADTQKALDAALAKAKQAEADLGPLAEDLSSARARSVDARTALDAAAAAYDKTGDDKAAADVLRARDASDLATRREVLSSARHQAGVDLHTAALAAVEDARQGLEAARVEARKAELRERVRMATFRTTVAPKVSAFLGALDALSKAAADLDAEFAAMAAAAAELAQLGEPVRDLDDAAPALLVAAGRVDAGAPISTDLFLGLIALRQKVPGSLSDLVRRFVDGFTFQGPHAQGASRLRLVEDLRTYLGGRTPAEGLALIQDARWHRGDAEEQNRRIVSQVEPPPPPSAA